MKKRTLFTALVSIMLIFTFVACSNNAAAPEDKLGRITFGDDNSRVVTTVVSYSEQVEDLIWFYKATKLDDGYTTGETKDWTPIAEIKDSNGSLDSAAMKGLSGKTLNNNFSYGLWKIVLEGYKDSNVSYSNGKVSLTDGATAEYKSEINNLLVSKDTNYAKAKIELGDNPTTKIVFDENGISFSDESIKSGQEFTLSVTDNKGTVGFGDNQSLTVEDGVVKAKGLVYTLTAGQSITGEHTMNFVLSHKLKNKDSSNTTENVTIKAALYTLKFDVQAGTTTKIGGTLLKNDETGKIEINSVQDVPELILSKAVPVDSESVDAEKGVAKVSADTTITYGNFSVVYPKGALISTSVAAGSLSEDKTTSDAKIGFTSVDTPTHTSIKVAANEAQMTYDLTLSASTGTGDNTKNTVLLTVSTFIGKGLEISKIYHAEKELVTYASLTDGNEKNSTESYDYNSETGMLTLRVFHASEFNILTKKAVASIGDTKYYSFKDAISNASDNATVTILNNVKEDWKGTDNQSGKITLSNNLILDLKSNSLKIENGTIELSSGKVLKVQNSKEDQAPITSNGVEVKNYTGSDRAYYTSLYDALAAVSENGVITLLEDSTLSAGITINKSLTLDLNEKKLDVNDNEIAIGTERSSYSVKIENGSIAYSSSDTVFSVGYGNALTLNKVTATGNFAGSYYGYSFVDVALSSDSSFSGSPSLTITESNISATGDTYSSLSLINVQEEESSAIGNTKNKANITIKSSNLCVDSKIGRVISIAVPSVGTIEDSTIKGNVNIVANLAGGSHTIKKTTIESTSTSSTAYALQVTGNNADNYFCDAEVTVGDDVKLKVSKGAAVALGVEGNAYGNTPKISGAIKAYLTGDSDTLDETGKYLKLDDNAIVDLKYNEIVARISKDGTTQAYYTSLYDAVLAAKDGETVILLCDASGSGLKSDDTVATGTRAITIDFNNHIYTMDNNSVGSSGTQTQAMHWGRSLTGLTLKNGTFAVSKNASSSNGNNVRTNFNMAMQCYIPLTAENMTFDLANVPNEQYDNTYNEPYKNTEKPHFNCYDTTTFTNCTINLNTENDYGLLAGESTTEGKVTLDNTSLKGNATFEAVGKGSITLKNGSTISGNVGSQFTDSNNEIKTETKDNVTTYTYVVRATV